MTPHIEALTGDYADTVLLPGDPLRAKWIAETFFEKPRLVNSVRNCLGYTGTYEGKPISVQAGGMCMPSNAIYITELFNIYNVLFRTFFSSKTNENLTNKKYIYKIEIYKP